MQAAFVLWVIVSATFLLLRFLPGGPFDSEKALPPEVKANIEAKYNLNAPLPEQYIAYIGKLLRGDFGESYKFIGRDVTDIISESLPVSFQLGLYAILISFMIGIPLGVFAASKHNTILDNGAMIVAMSGVALPSFLVAPVLILIFSYHLGWLPPALWIGPVYYILPVVTLGVRPAAIIARLTRSSVLDTIHSDFVRTAKAKGLGWRTVLFKHVLKNSLIPVITIAAPLVAQILSGTFIIELIFAIPGMGKHFIQSVTNRDYPLVLGVTIVYATLLVLANLLVDVLYAFLDPRIKLS
ncbi:MAG: peptide ABC transporter permease [Bdellovibrionales bacterium CG10_big_fil_rev_8_21_14_0_10_45_34]|nr:MAG: peptide ABC transporter permease [Bdellovibrionales bacterium CG10_big_fil_rev_8_21_14_0_10_45_34]